MGEKMPDVPYIIIGMDAQPIENFDKVLDVGCNALHRYDSGPQKSVTAAAWMAAARQKSLFYVVQGTAFDAQGYDFSQPDPFLLALAQDDEPDLNRYDSQKGKISEEVLRTYMYTPTSTYHPNVIGWTLPDVLKDRYERWKAKAPNLPILLNFNGQSWINAYYGDGKFHRPYLPFTDWIGLDLYTRNARGTSWPLYYLSHAFDKLAATGEPTYDAYIECSDQVLDGDASGGPNRGPTPIEQSTSLWSVLMHGAKRVWYFPQQIGKDAKTGQAFQYWNIKPENADQMRIDNAIILKYQKLIALGKRTLVQTPVAQANYSKGTVVFPTKEVCTWELDGQKLTVEIDLNGVIPPIITVPDVPPPTVPELQQQLKLAQDQLRTAIAKLGEKDAAIAARDAQIATMTVASQQKDAQIAAQAAALAAANTALSSAHDQVKQQAAQIVAQGLALADKDHIIADREDHLQKVVDATAAVASALTTVVDSAKAGLNR
jgi:hypothetical protein